MPSRSNKLFQKRKAKGKAELARRRATRPVRQRVLIVTEGSKTEPLYLKALVAKLGLTTAQIKICHECGSAPISVFEFGEKMLLSEDDDFELIYFVFDRDSDSSYDAALARITSLGLRRKFKHKTVAAITSIPCFEIWFVLHFEEHTKPYVAGGGKSPCVNLISELRKKPGFEDYKKGHTNHFELLYDRMKDAKRNSGRILKQLHRAGCDKHHENPSTRMHLLVRALEKLARDGKN